MVDAPIACFVDQGEDGLHAAVKYYSLPCNISNKYWF